MEVQNLNSTPPVEQGGEKTPLQESSGLPDSVTGISDLFLNNMPKAENYAVKTPDPGPESQATPTSKEPPKKVRGKTDKHGRTFDPTIHESDGGKPAINSEGFLKMKPGRPRLEAHCIKPAEKKTDAQGEQKPAAQVVQKTPEMIALEREAIKKKAAQLVGGVNFVSKSTLPEFGLCDEEKDFLTEAVADFMEETGWDGVTFPPLVNLAIAAGAVYVPKYLALKEARKKAREEAEAEENKHIPQPVTTAEAVKNEEYQPGEWILQ